MMQVVVGVDDRGCKRLTFTVATPVTVAVVVDEASTPTKVWFQRQ